MQTVSWWMIRHAKVTEMQHVIYGRADPKGDTSVNTPQYAVIANYLPSGALAICSSKRRTKDTLHAVQEAGWRPKDTMADACFDEQNFGTWEGKTHDEVATQDPLISKRFWLTPTHIAAPNGESFSDVYNRACKGFLYYTNYAYQHNIRHIILFTHGGVLRALNCYALNMPLESALRFSIDNLSLSQIDMLRDDSSQQLYPRINKINAIC